MMVHLATNPSSHVSYHSGFSSTPQQEQHCLKAVKIQPSRVDPEKLDILNPHTMTVLHVHYLWVCAQRNPCLLPCCQERGQLGADYNWRIIHTTWPWLPSSPKAFLEQKACWLWARLACCCALKKWELEERRPIIKKFQPGLEGQQTTDWINHWAANLPITGYELCLPKVPERTLRTNSLHKLSGF